MKEIIENDPVLNYFINEASIDWYNNHHVELRCNALKVALAHYIDALVDKL